jgi:inosine/xanthosine triphosphate pyrophosphatase family protein
MLQDRRRMSYKALNDRTRQKALAAFLEMANEIEGWIASFCITRRADTLFQKPDIDQTAGALLDTWKPNVQEQALRILHLSSFLLTGLSKAGQDLLWISDEDEIAANQSQLEKLTTAFGNVWSNYAEHSLHHIRCGTTIVDDGSLAIEDLAAIPDIVAGALSEISSTMSRDNRMPVLNVLTPFPKGLSEKARFVAAWLSQKSAPLQRVTCFIHGNEEGQKTKLSAKMVRWHALPTTTIAP